MKKVVLLLTFVLALVLAIATQAAHGSIAAPQTCTAGKPHPAVMTVKRLHMWGQPIGYGASALAKGPIWDPDQDFQARPGQGKTMVIYGHDVTPVPGYGAHGPFYRLHLMKQGDVSTITRCGVAYTYRYVRSSTPWQCSTKSASLDPRRYWGNRPGALICAPNTKSIKNWGVETLYLRCCWPRHTMNQYFTVRLVLVKIQPAS
jgi:hypothetical protein